MRFRPLFVLASLLLGSAAHAQSTAFTYQGELKNAGLPVNGLQDVRFSLFSAATGGVQVGATQCVDNVLVVNGVFTTTIDFGQQFTTTAARFLLIEVRADTGLTCSAATGFTALSPRQPITATPFANHAKSAFALDAADGSPVSAVLVDNDGRVGIGTAAPTHSVHIANTGPTIALQDTDSTTQQVGYISYRDSGNVERAWVGYGTAGSPDFSIINARAGGDIVLTPLAGDNVLLAGNGGNVGIGTATPTARLEVQGDVRSAGRYHGGAPVQRYKSIHGSTFQPATEEGTPAPATVRYADGIIGRRQSDGLCTENYYYAPVELPDGAVITNVLFTLYDNSACGTYGELYRLSLFSGQLNAMVTFPLSDINGTNVRVVSSSNISFPTVDNSVYAYVLRVHMSGLNRESGLYMRLLGARIGYETNIPYP